MASSQPFPARPLPRGLIVFGSIAIVFHLFALVVLAVAAQSGPWPTPLGLGSPAEPPEFTKGISSTLLSSYLEPLHLTHNYHFDSNRPETSFVYFEVKLRDADGKLLKSLKFPDADANYWVRHRQSLLAQSLGNDQPYQPPQSVRIPSPTVRVWYSEQPRQESKLEEKLERDLQELRSKQNIEVFFQPSDYSLLLAKSYARYLCRTYGAAKAEIIRHSREAILPAIVLPMITEQPLFERTFNSFVANFGDQSGGK